MRAPSRHTQLKRWFFTIAVRLLNDYMSRLFVRVSMHPIHPELTWPIALSIAYLMFASRICKHTYRPHLYGFKKLSASEKNPILEDLSTSRSGMTSLDGH